MDKGAWWATVHGVAKTQTLMGNQYTQVPREKCKSRYGEGGGRREEGGGRREEGEGFGMGNKCIPVADSC